MHTESAIPAKYWLPFLLPLCLGVAGIALIYVHVRMFWFPAPFFTASGGWQGIKLVGILVVLGALLSLVVFNPLKSRRVLPRDVGLIVGLQCLALACGAYVLHGQRPVAVVFWESEFLTVTANELLEHGYSVGELERFGTSGPVWVYRPKPASAEGLREILKQATVNKVPPHHQISAYLPYRDYFSEFAWHSLDIDKITRANRSMKEELDELLQKTGGKSVDYLYLALKSKYRNVVVVFTKSGERIGYLYAPYLREI